MKQSGALLSVFVVVVVVSGCVRDTPERRAEQRRSAEEPAADVAATSVSTVATGKVVETMSVENYTYVQVDTGTEKVWAAAPKCEVKVGDELAIPAGDLMSDYHSKTLDRDFDKIYFVGTFYDAAGKPLGGATPGMGSGMPPGHPPIGGDSPMNGHPPVAGTAAPANVDFSGLQKPEGGMTIAEIYAGRNELADKEVTLRGKVVKFNPQIMGTNWLHVQDGSGDVAQGTNDLTVTSDVITKVGDTVLVTGVVHLDKDFGFGYKYGTIIEDAKVSVE